MATPHQKAWSDGAGSKHGFHAGQVQPAPGSCILQLCCRKEGLGKTNHHVSVKPSPTTLSPRRGEPGKEGTKTERICLCCCTRRYRALQGKVQGRHTSVLQCGCTLKFKPSQKAVATFRWTQTTSGDTPDTRNAVSLQNPSLPERFLLHQKKSSAPVSRPA